MATEISGNIGLEKGMLPDGTKKLPESGKLYGNAVDVNQQ